MTDSATPAQGTIGRLAAVRERIARAARDAGRDPAAVTLVAVAKTMPAVAVEAAWDAGQRVFGENRVQEAAGKYPALRLSRPGLQLHLVGPLQSNKVAQACALFDVIETLDREKLARALALVQSRGTALPALLIQVNTGREPQKAGIAPETAAAFIDLCRDRLQLPVRGLMCIPPQAEAPAPHFAFLAELARRHGLPWLSMGMSGDFEAAIQQGATHVRVGTAIFGGRAAAG
ncbi:MAG: YggS family pyridoxal phosphate-dependent enzyme [Alphaproteobacteria bacterium]